MILIANFVAPFGTVTLSLAAVFNSLGPVLGQIVAGGAGPTNICPRPVGACTCDRSSSGGTGDGSGRGS